VSAKAKLFTHGGSQAVRLPRAFRFEGKEVSIRKEGDRVILEPVKVVKESWEEFWAQIDALGAGKDFAAPPRADWPEPVRFNGDQ